MTSLKTRLAAGLLALVSLSASATTFDFSYSFDPANTGDGNPVVLSGSFDGTQAGSLFTGISNFQIALNGTAFSGPLQVEAWNNATSNWDALIAPVISTDVTQANFIVADADVSTNPAGVSNYFYVLGGQAVAITFNVTDAGGNPLEGVETASNASWDVSAVPEPANTALLMAGLGLLGALARRRKI